MPDSLPQVYTALGKLMRRGLFLVPSGAFLSSCVHRLRINTATPEVSLKFAAGAELRRQKDLTGVPGRSLWIWHSFVLSS